MSFAYIVRRPHSRRVGRAGHDEYRNPGERRIGSHRCDARAPVHHGQLQIKKDQVWPRQLTGHFERLGAVGGDEDVAALPPQDALDEIGRLRFIFGDEDQWLACELRKR